MKKDEREYQVNFERRLRARVTGEVEEWRIESLWTGEVRSHCDDEPND